MGIEHIGRVVRKAIEYFTTNKTRMNHPDYAALGITPGLRHH